MSPDGPRRPTLLVFDVNETLSDMSPMGQRFEDVGAPAHLAKTWFAGLLRDGFALTAVNASEPFARLAAEALRISLHGLSLNRDTEEAVEHIMAGFAGLGVHADVPDGIRALSALGIRLVTLSNGSASVAEALFDRAGIRDHFEALLSVEQAGMWKPAAGAYAYALEQCGVDPDGRHAGRRPPLGHRRRRARGSRHGLDRPTRWSLPGLLQVPGPRSTVPDRAGRRSSTADLVRGGSRPVCRAAREMAAPASPRIRSPERPGCRGRSARSG